MTGIPTSRAATIVVSDDEVIRDPMYDGHPLLEKLAVVLRIAPTWFRFGSFELPTKTNETHLLQKLFDFILKVGPIYNIILLSYLISCILLSY